MKESSQRQELHKQIWAVADKVRGSVDGWDFKQYILGFLFYRFISENMIDFFNKAEHEAGDLSFNYADITDEEAEQDFREGTVESKGFFILPSQLFSNILKNAKSNDNLNIDIANALRQIEASAEGTDAEDDFKGLFGDIDTSSNKLGKTVENKNKRLFDILDGISKINFSDFQKNEIDAFGDAYEFLISNYASNAGKSGGEFFTPQSVSKLVARLVIDGKTKINKVYDPTCGSASLLLQVKKQFGDFVEGGYYGQDINMTNYNLARMNMFLHDVNYTEFSIKHDDTLINPQHLEERPFDAIVSNPPYGLNWIGDNDPTLINDDRFAPAGVLAPKGKADFAFIMHTLSHLSSQGKAAIVCFPGIFYTSGANQKIRKYLVENNFVESLIALPGNLFFGTSIATTILVLSKNKVGNKTKFIDTTKIIEQKGKNTHISDENIEKIMELINSEDVQYFSKSADISEIAQNDYNLSVNSYVEVEDTREKIDIKELTAEISQTVEKINTLRSDINQIIKELENE